MFSPAAPTAASPRFDSALCGGTNTEMLARRSSLRYAQALANAPLGIGRRLELEPVREILCV